MVHLRDPGVTPGATGGHMQHTVSTYLLLAKDADRGIREYDGDALVQGQYGGRQKATQMVGPHRRSNWSVQVTK